MPGDPGALSVPWERNVKEENLYLPECLSLGEALWSGKGHFDKTSGVESEVKRRSQVRRNIL